MIDEHDSPYSDDLHAAVGALWHAEKNPNPTGRRTAAQAMLAKLAAGDRSEEVLLFAETLAEALLAAGGEQAGDEKTRAGKVLRAAGLGGRLVETPQWVEVALRDYLGEGWSPAAQIRKARASGMLGAEIDDTTASKQLDRGLKKHIGEPYSLSDEERSAAGDLGL